MNEDITSDALDELLYSGDGAKIRERILADGVTEAMKMFSGISDQAILNKLVDVDIRSDTLTAFSITPLILVAWADGVLDDDERKAISKSAQAEGISPGSSAGLLLDYWLNTPPGEIRYDLMRTCYTQLARRFDDFLFIALKEKIRRCARKVAASGVGSVSVAKQEMLDKIASVFT